MECGALISAFVFLEQPLAHGRLDSGQQASMVRSWIGYRVIVALG